MAGLRFPSCASVLLLGTALMHSAASYAVEKPSPFGTVELPSGAGAPILEGPKDQPVVPVKRTRGAAGTLILAHGTNGATSGQFARVQVTALSGPASKPAEIGYDRFLGPMTMKSLGRVATAMAAMHHGWPQGKNFQFTFTEKPLPSELVPSTLAAALAMDSMYRDYDIEPSYAAIGAILEDGFVEAVGGVPERLAGAARARVARIVIPEKNTPQVSDYLLSEGVGAFVGTQIFSVTNFNEAGVLALTKLDDRTAAAVKLFGSVQRTLAFAPGNAVNLLRGEGVQGVLRKVLASAPNHYSAKVLVDWGTGKQLAISFDGSVDFVDRRGADLIRALRAKPEAALQMPKKQLSDDLASLRAAADRLDPGAKPYAAALVHFGETLEKCIGNSSKPPAKLDAASQQAFDAARQQGNDEWQKLAVQRAKGSES